MLESHSIIDYIIDFPLFTTEVHIMKGAIDFANMEAKSLTNCRELCFQGNQSHPHFSVGASVSQVMQKTHTINHMAVANAE